MSKNSNSGLGLIGILLIIGALILTAGGVVVWEKKVSPTATPAPTQTSTPLSPPPSQQRVKTLQLPVVFKKTWVEIDPIQCFWNTWEKDWLETHGEDTFKYPQGDPLIIEEPEAGIIKNYYGKRGIEIFDLQSVKFENTAVCRACSCKQGYRLYLLISNSDIDEMIDFGYKVVEQ